MKKTFIIICIMLITVSSVFAGCGKKKDENNETNSATENVNTQNAAASLADSQYVGTWKAVRAEFGGKEVKVEEVMENGFNVTFNADGTASVTSDDGDESAGNWTETSEGVSIKGNEMDMTFKNADGSLVFELFGAHIYFEKQ